MSSSFATTPASLPVVLSIAGSDNSAGAGLQADLKTITLSGCYGLTAVTCVVAEVPGKVFGIQPVKPQLVALQIHSCFEAFPVAAIKTGMLFSPAIVLAVADALDAERKRRLKQGIAPFHLVVDPVMVASSGDPLLKPAAITLYQKRLFPAATVITPNLDELAFLYGENLSSEEAMRQAGTQLAQRYQTAILCKGGHLGGPEAVDWLVSPTLQKRYSAKFIENAETHGTGCTFASAIAAQLALGNPLPQAIAKAKKLITRAIATACMWGQTRALNLQPR